MTPKLQILALLSGLLCIPAASAHHAWPVSREKLVTVQGTVTAFSWANPHPMITIDVQLADGSTEEWNIGGPAINRMVASGWSAETVKPGDVITGSGYQFADGSKIIRLEKVILPDGSAIAVYGRL